MELEDKNYYEILEIPTNATQEEVNKAYIRSKNAYSGESLALYSLMPKDECSKILEMVEEAYMVLSVAEKRREYDRVRGINCNRAANGKEDHFFRPNAPTTVSGPDYQKSMAQVSEKLSHSGITTFSTHRRGHFDRDQEFSIHRNDGAETSRLSAANRFSLNFEKDNEIEQEIESTDEFTGTFLKKVREYKNVDIPRMADMTKISKTYIKNIEKDDWENLPAFPYTRGFVYQYAKCLKLNPDLVATSYIHHLKNLKNAHRKKA